MSRGCMGRGGTGGQGGGVHGPRGAARHVPEGQLLRGQRSTLRRVWSRGRADLAPHHERHPSAAGTLGAMRTAAVPGCDWRAGWGLQSWSRALRDAVGHWSLAQGRWQGVRGGASCVARSAWMEASAELHVADGVDSVVARRFVAAWAWWP